MRLALAAFVCAFALAPAAFAADLIELTPEVVRSVKGDGPDGKGNTGDDTWGFWFALMHANEFRRLDIATATMSAAERKHGRRRKIRGPIGQWMPKGSEGWIYHSDWDGRGEGVWGDAEGKQVLAHPYQEKTQAGAVAITCRIPKDGTYTISGKATDAQPVNYKALDGVQVRIDQADDGRKVGKILHTSEPFGDKHGGGKKNSVEFKVGNVKLTKGELVRLTIMPGRTWGTDKTKIDSFKIERTGE
jgi:hypothetical protein